MAQSFEFQNKVTQKVNGDNVSDSLNIEEPMTTDENSCSDSALDFKPSTACSFGIIADVQYADIPDGTNYAQTEKRYYRNSLYQLRTAVSKWKAEDVDFVIDLGDLIDGHGKRNNQSEVYLVTVLNEYKQLNKPVYFHWGNHDFYNFKREEIIRLTHEHSFSRPDGCQIKDSKYNYFHWSPCAGFRVIFIDPYEISLLGCSRRDPNYIKAETILKSKNYNRDWHESKNLRGKDKRFVKYNGALSEVQLNWLDQVLEESDGVKEKVIVTSHVPVFERATGRTTLIWNYEEVLAIFHKHTCVTAHFSGHNHNGGYAVDSHGIHHITMQGVIESEPGVDTFAIVTVDNEGMTINGFGRIPKHINIPLAKT